MNFPEVYVDLPSELYTKEIWLDINSEQFKQVWLDLPPERVKQIWLHLSNMDVKRIWIDMPVLDAGTTTTSRVESVTVEAKAVLPVDATMLEELKKKESEK